MIKNWFSNKQNRRDAWFVGIVFSLCLTFYWGIHQEGRIAGMDEESQDLSGVAAWEEAQKAPQPLPLPSGVSDTDGIRAIVGEASNQSFHTKICVGQAIRYRGTIEGVYGVHARHNEAESSETWAQATEAWRASAIEDDQVKGSKNFGTRGDLRKLGIKKWNARCGAFYFY